MSKTKQLAETKKKLKEYNVTVNYQPEWEQYRVNFLYGLESTAFYTNDLEDALHTGRLMEIRNIGLQGVAK